MSKVSHFLAVVGLLATTFTVYGQGTGTNQQRDTWACVCDPGGLIGTQVYTGDVKQGFTQCSCSSGCPLCPAGQVLDPSSERNNTCVCLSPLLVIIRLLQLNLSSYTVKMEKTFVNNLASSLDLSPSQVMPITRRNGSVILDLYIFPLIQGPENYLVTVGELLMQRNITQNGSMDSLLGHWNLVYVTNGSIQEGQVYTGISSGKGSNEKLLLLILLLCATFIVALLLLSLIFLMYCKRENLGHCFLWFKKDSNPSYFRALINHRSSPIEEFQVYDNTCFNGSTGCIGRRSFKTNPRMGALGSMTRLFSYVELEEATCGFGKPNVIGIGGSSCVYQGQLKDGRNVAIKRLTTQGGPGLDQEFLLEVELLSRLHHFHLVPLVGYCVEIHGRDLERLLVYEFMENGNLREHLNDDFGKKTLTWNARLRIALGAARGLEYLHEAADPRVLHRDFKSSNILLDAKWRAKVADFGMATTIKDVDCNACPSSPAQMLGTFGYFAPEYAMMGRATVKSDVFSFGVVLLELITGRQPLNKSLPLGQESLVVWALPLLRDRARLVNELADPVLEHCFPVEDAQRMTHLAWLCLQTDPESRPTMTSVVQVLATLIPENIIKMNDFGPLMEAKARHQDPWPLPWAQDYSFSREDDSQAYAKFSPDFWSVASSPNVYDQCRIASLDCYERERLPVDIEEETIRKKWEQTKQSNLRSTSLSAAEYLQKFSAMTVDDPVNRSSEEEVLDLVKPRLEYFWQNNGLVVQVHTPGR